MVRIAPGLRKDGDGIWKKESTATISFPETGHDDVNEVEGGSFWFKHRNKCILAAIDRLPPPGRIFDIGGGNGFVAIALQREGFDVALVEPGISGASRAKARGVDCVICVDFEQAGFLPGTLPAASLFDVLEHVENDRGFLRRLRDAMQTDGRVYLTVPALPWLWSVSDEYSGHFRRYTRKSLIDVVSSSGFRIEYVSYFFRFLAIPMFFMRSVPSAFGMLRSVSTRHVARVHTGGVSVGRKLFDGLLAGEPNLIARGRRIGIGASLMVVARCDGISGGNSSLPNRPQSD